MDRLHEIRSTLEQMRTDIDAAYAVLAKADVARRTLYGEFERLTLQLAEDDAPIDDVEDMILDIQDLFNATYIDM